MNFVKPIFNVKPFPTNILRDIPIHEGFVRLVIQESIRERIQNQSSDLSMDGATPRKGDQKPIEQFFIGSPNERPSIKTEKAPSSPRTIIISGPQQCLHREGRERHMRRLHAQKKRESELAVKHAKEIQEFRKRLDESTRCCRDDRSHLEREADFVERRERRRRKGLELLQQRENDEFKLCTFKPMKALPVPASNRTCQPKTCERRLCRLRKNPPRQHSLKTNKPLEPIKPREDDSTTDESNTSSTATIRWVRPTLSFAAGAIVNL